MDPHLPTLRVDHSPLGSSLTFPLCRCSSRLSLLLGRVTIAPVQSTCLPLGRQQEQQQQRQRLVRRAQRMLSAGLYRCSRKKKTLARAKLTPYKKGDTKKGGEEPSKRA